MNSSKIKDFHNCACYHFIFALIYLSDKTTKNHIAFIRRKRLWYRNIVIKWNLKIIFIRWKIKYLQKEWKSKKTLPAKVLLAPFLLHQLFGALHSFPIAVFENRCWVSAEIRWFDVDSTVLPAEMSNGSVPDRQEDVIQFPDKTEAVIRGFLSFSSFLFALLKVRSVLEI